MRKKLTLIFFTALVGLTIQLPALYAAPAAVHLDPSVVPIGASYNGTHVTLSGTVPQGADVLIRLSGETTDEVFLKKRKVLGILWMNTDKITFHHIPKTYLLYTPATITAADLTDSPRWRELGVGFDALKKVAELSPASENPDEQFAELLKLKTKEKAYGIYENAVTYPHTDKGKKFFRGDLTIPCAIPPGSYTVTAFIFKDGNLMETVNQELKIEEVGLPAIISTLAFDHSVLYGLLSVLIAIFAGLLMGAVFKQGGEAH